MTLQPVPCFLLDQSLWGAETSCAHSFSSPVLFPPNLKGLLHPFPISSYLLLKALKPHHVHDSYSILNNRETLSPFCCQYAVCADRCNTGLLISFCGLILPTSPFPIPHRFKSPEDEGWMVHLPCLLHSSLHMCRLRGKCSISIK